MASSTTPEPQSRLFHVDGQALPAPGLEPGLYIVATPIGNLGDITLRALRTLAAADIVACEDTRVTRKLMERYSIKTPLFSYHEHNAARQGPKLVARISDGDAVALVSDAGTPLISDPGYRLVEQVLDEGARVVPIPGASAPLAALMASGLPTDAFHFAGFLPTKALQRARILSELAAIDATVVLFESPRRLVATLDAIAEQIGDSRTCIVARELTKAFETFHRGTAADLVKHFEAEPPRGEIVLLLSPPAEAGLSEDDVIALLREALATQSPSKAAAQVAKASGLDRNAVYRIALTLRDGDPEAAR